MRVVFLGKPGSGKGTQASRLVANLGLSALATGNLVRSAIASGSQLGLEFKSYSERGLLVPDDLIVRLLSEALLEVAGADLSGSFLLDGFPRTVAQAESLEQFLLKHHKTLDHVIDIRVPDALLLERASGRRFCPNDGRSYHVVFAPPRAVNQCDLCHAELITRVDDSHDVVLARLVEYRDKTEPLVHFYQEKSLLRIVDGVGDLDTVYNRICSVLGAQ